ncbi:Uma2 family endonuclease [Microaerobacter geothermalis]|uniref:Uma2 family endonuclease n=1 Tax=Microaerobacter geothermalis TaxID=674972 RepID=UPI001F277A1F|nr:Uma2 family endonuclease [Microaerobacter geothermalis]MCF6093699.1 Uma2 family endonuclease [Microaerobacter geothermalis]
MSSTPSEKSQKVVKEQQEAYQEANIPKHYPFIEERYEIINNIRYDLKPSPTVKHQRILGYLHKSLDATCHNNGVIIFAPMDVYLDEGNIFQPDLIFILHENSEIIKEARIEGAPDLVAEILSPSTSQNDKIRKKAQYERFGVKEYWIVDPVHFTVDQFVLENGRFLLNATYGEGDTLTSDLFSCVSIDLSPLFDQIR